MTPCFKNANGGREYTSEVKCLPRTRFDYQDTNENWEIKMQKREGMRGEILLWFWKLSHLLLFLLILNWLWFNKDGLKYTSTSKGTIFISSMCCQPHSRIAYLALALCCPSPYLAHPSDPWVSSWAVSSGACYSSQFRVYLLVLYSVFTCFTSLPPQLDMRVETVSFLFLRPFMSYPVLLWMNMAPQTHRELLY